MITFMSNLFELNLRFAPHPHTGSKWREICFCNAGSFRLISASEIVLERLTIEIVGFTVPFPLHGNVGLTPFALLVRLPRSMESYPARP